MKSRGFFIKLNLIFHQHAKYEQLIKLKKFTDKKISSTRLLGSMKNVDTFVISVFRLF